MNTIVFYGCYINKNSKIIEKVNNITIIIFQKYTSNISWFLLYYQDEIYKKYPDCISDRGESLVKSLAIDKNMDRYLNHLIKSYTHEILVKQMDDSEL